MNKPHFHLNAVLIPPPEMLRNGTKPEGFEYMVPDEELVKAVTDSVLATLSSGILEHGGVYTLIIQRCAIPSGHVN